ncbi:hypothetical protein HPB50_000593 [Hyalomma asiaticum]|uniref:Uncharacterized protein n=1 Tax=Hyalomma asiaticum TaxID=266040 RepID=A0ACB7RH33_HYAAI|nr:hypothetical protein HPB50_000593 [Hyalomma asiaticum]
MQGEPALDRGHSLHFHDDRVPGTVSRKRTGLHSGAYSDDTSVYSLSREDCSDDDFQLVRSRKAKRRKSTRKSTTRSAETGQPLALRSVASFRVRSPDARRWTFSPVKAGRCRKSCLFNSAVNIPIVDEA